MKYFTTGRKSGDYHEFVRGSWDGKTFWSDDYIFLDDDTLNEYLAALFYAVSPAYYPYGPSEITRAEWGEISRRAEELGGETQAIIQELSPWAEDNFKTESIFTILGI